MSTPAILILDVGKTNKKIILFNECYDLIHEEDTQLPEVKDDDGFPCENVEALTTWVIDSVQRICATSRYSIRAINFTSYGASFVHLGTDLKPVTPLYNYLKPFPRYLHDQFYLAYGGESSFAIETSSPVLGNLNSGLQLFRLKYDKPELFKQIRYSLHLPQYLSFLICGKLNTDITSVGCHTCLWDFKNRQYHSWVQQEKISGLFSDIHPSDEPAGEYNNSVSKIPVGIGLHDSSAALIPYLASFHEPFILISTGTWCISLNPFNHLPLTKEELDQDCLCYLTYQGKPVKASRLFAGNTHEQQTRRLSDYFKTAISHYVDVKCDTQLLNRLKSENTAGAFEDRDLSSFQNYHEAYHQLMVDIVRQQVQSTNLVMKGPSVHRIFIDGGFSKNSIYMHLLSGAFPGIEVIAASVPQATSLGAALSIHKYWNREKSLSLKF